MTTWRAVTVMTMSAMAMTACGGRSPERMEKMVQWRVDDAMDELDATQAQRDEVQALVKDGLSKARPLGDGVKAARSTLVSEWKSTSPDGAKVHQLVDAQLEALRGFAHDVTDKALSLHRLLTPKQREQVSVKLDAFEKRTR